MVSRNQSHTPLSSHVSEQSRTSQDVQAETEALTAIDLFMSSKINVSSKLPEGARQEFRKERFINAIRIGTILGVSATSETSAAQLGRALGSACSEIEEIQHLGADKWRSILQGLAHLKGTHVDHSTSLINSLQRAISGATSAAVKEALELTFSKIEWGCFLAPKSDAIIRAWLAPENKAALDEIIAEYRRPSREKGASRPVLEVAAEDSPVASTNAMVLAAPPAAPAPVPVQQAPSLADALMPQIDRSGEKAQIAIQVGQGLFFAQAGEGQDIVVSNKGGAVSITIRPGQ